MKGGKKNNRGIPISEQFLKPRVDGENRQLSTVRTSQIDQAATSLRLLLVWALSRPRVVRRLSKACRLWDKLLLVIEGVVACVSGSQTIQTLTGRVDEGAWSSMLGWDT